MRKLMWFTVGFAGSCGLIAAGWQGTLWLTAGILLLLAAGTFAAGRRWKKLRPISAIFLGCFAGILWVSCFEQSYLEPARELDGKTQTQSIVLSSYSRKTEYGAAADGKISLDGHSYQVRLYLEEDPGLEPGDRLTGSFRFRYTGSGGAKESDYLQGKAIYLIANQKGELTTEKGAVQSFQILAQRLQKKLLTGLEAVFPADTLGFAKALLLGITEDLEYKTDTAFQISGIRHVIAVSGLHVSILFSVISLLCLGNRWLTAAIGFPVLAMFAALAGFSPSVVRACVMQGILILSMLCWREYDPPTALAAAVLLILVLNPMTILSVSLQLSVGCMIGIFLFAQPIFDYITSRRMMQYRDKRSLKAKAVNFTAGTLSVSISAVVMTAPLCAWHFQVISLVGLLTNFVALWIVPLLFHGILLACLMGYFWLRGGMAVAWAISWGIRYVMEIADVLSRLPFSALYIRNGYLVLWLLFAYVLLTVFLAARDRQPMVLTLCLILSLLVAVNASWAEPLTDHCRVTVVDVGQGQSVILQSEGKTFLVDCGGQSDRYAADAAAQELLCQGISRIDGLIVTHYDEDHIGGVPYFLSRIECPMVFLPETVQHRESAEKISACGSEVYMVSGEIGISFGNTNLTIFPPIVPDHGNESSLCVLFQPENYDILLTGDRSALGERILLAETELPELELLVAGHHGSASSTCEELLEATRPETVIISAGFGNRYGHPAQTVLDRLERYGCAVFRTDLQGTIVYRR